MSSSTAPFMMPSPGYPTGYSSSTVPNRCWPAPAATEEEAAARQHARQHAEEQKQQQAVRTAGEAESVLRRAGELQGQGDARGAVAVLEQLVRREPDTAIGWFTLGWYFGRDGNFRRSTRCYKRGLKLDGRHKTAWNNLGHDLRGMRRHKCSAQALRQAIALDPEYVTAWANLGTTLREKNKFAEASRAFDEVVRRRESDGTAWYWLGDCRSRCGQHQGAVDAFLRASVIHPDNAALWMQLGDSLRRLGRAREAAEAYARARALGLPPPRLHSDLALWVFLAMGASFGADRLASTTLGLTAVGAFGAAVMRLRPDRVKLFWIAVAALPLSAMQFLDTCYAAPISMGLLVVWTAIIAKIWKYRRRKTR